MLLKFGIDIFNSLDAMSYELSGNVEISVILSNFFILTLDLNVNFPWNPPESMTFMGVGTVNPHEGEYFHDSWCEMKITS